MLFKMLKTIKHIIEKEFSLPDISDATRVYPYPEARAMFYEIAKISAPAKSFSKIAAVVNRDHATALHAIQMLNDTYLRDYEIIEIYDNIKEVVFKEVTLHKHKFSELEMLRRENEELKRKLKELQKI